MSVSIESGMYTVVNEPVHCVQSFRVHHLKGLPCIHLSSHEPNRVPPNRELTLYVRTYVSNS